MIKPNWNVFRVKFGENPQLSFEWLCYVLFCQEHNKSTGIFRYRNQSAIETNPIASGNEVIGWQAKFYETTLSSHKAELLETIEKCRRDYADLTKLMLYSNQDWGQGKMENEPQAKIEIEQKAKKLNINVEWRTASFFESPFVCLDNEAIAEHFFDLGTSVFDAMKEMQKHTENILYDIHTNIDFGGKKVEIDRSQILQQFREAIHHNQILIISGTGGVGKTAVVKSLYLDNVGDLPLYVLKASEFNRDSVNDLFHNCSLQEFISAHGQAGNRIIVIDSAEKILDLENVDTFKTFLTGFVQAGWKFIFTARSSYLLDLDSQFIDNYRITPAKFFVENLREEELERLSQEQGFKLPEDHKLLDLIRNLFYLSEFLNFYGTGEREDYLSFKKTLWDRIIKKSLPSREQCFLQLALQRVNEGQFFVVPGNISDALDEMCRDGILGYETAGYFITHDIYEEWALEKIIDAAFVKRTKDRSLFDAIGSSLPMRRAFRNWMSEKLLLKDKEIQAFIEEGFSNNAIAAHWRDDILISVLLSDYSNTFFELFRDTLLEGNQELFARLTFLLRIACKEVDSDLLRQLGLGSKRLSALNLVLTKPVGAGWASLVEFMHNNFEKIVIRNIQFVLPVVHDWNSKFRQGSTTRLSGLIALKYYQWSIGQKVHLSRRESFGEKLLQTIMHAASEIKEELSVIFDEILKNGRKDHRDPYHGLVQATLTKFGDNIEVIKALPQDVLKLADLYWIEAPREDEDSYASSSFGIEQYFGMDGNHIEYYPASAYQTPTYWLLRSSLKATIDFILDFTNKVVESFAKSEFAKHEVEEVSVIFDDGTVIRQYLCVRLWNIFRGTQVAPDVLESMHMALEKFFLENGGKVESKVLQEWLLYLLKNSKSSSITAIVASIVMAFPDKTFEVAKILFKTKKFFFYDTSRFMLDQTAKSLFSFGSGLNYEHRIHEDERIKTCDDKHRQMALEHLALNYQFFKGEGISDAEAERRQSTIWSIFDEYYSELQDELKESGHDKTWQLYLARMDRRKMNPSIEQKEGRVVINFNPEIEPEVKEYSDAALQKNAEVMKYVPLKLWANYRMKRNENYKQYEQYENQPQVALREARDIADKLKAIKKPEPVQSSHTEEETYFLFNHSIPAEVCSVLVRESIDQLSEDDKAFCRDTILAAASSSFEKHYGYQISDGVESAISVLPALLKHFPEEKEEIKTILLVTLFNPRPIGEYGPFSDYSARAILNDMWGVSFDDAQSILLGYLVLMPKYEALREQLRQEGFRSGVYELEESTVIDAFLKSQAGDLHKALGNGFVFKDVKNIEEFKLSDLGTAFRLIPTKVTDPVHKKIVQAIISVFAVQLLSDNREDKIEYRVRHRFLEKLACLVLNSDEEDIQEYLAYFGPEISKSEGMAKLFQAFIQAEDRLNLPGNFWVVWRFFKEGMVEMCNQSGDSWDAKSIIKSYLFAESPWNDTAREWHSLTIKEEAFLEEIALRMGHCPSVLYSILRLLDGVGSVFIGKGVGWISSMLTKNKSLSTDELEANTIYYMENLAKKYLYENRERVRRTKILKDEIAVILDFLVEKGSVVGYLLRESTI